jgi:sulfite dehydrogenase
MRRSFKKAISVCGVALALASLALAQGGARGQRGGGGQQPQPPASAGAALLERSCSNCHGAEVIATYHYEKPEEYRDIVNAMIGVGAQLTPQEVPVLVDYLFATYGKKPAGAAPGGQTPAPAPAADPGKAILESACTVCHGLDGMANHAYETKDPYESLVRNMIGYGANVTDAQVPVVAEYMLKTYGKKPAASAANATPATPATPADPGKAILESACTVCHGLDGMANHKYESKTPYESLVRSMVAYGAVVSDAQMGPLVDYMFKTYGKK